MQPTSTPAPTARVSGQLVVVLASLAAVAPIATDLYLPGFPAISADLDAGASGVQLSLTAFLAGLAVGQLVMGPLSDRWGRRRPLVASSAASVVAGAACALAPTLPALVGARFVHGLAGAGGMVIGRAVVADLVSGPAAARKAAPDVRVLPRELHLEPRRRRDAELRRHDRRGRPGLPPGP